MADSAKDFIVKQNLKVVGNIVSAGAGSVFTGDGSQLNDVDAVTLGGESGGFYRDATNLNAGTVSNDRLPATITKNISGNVTGNVDATGGSGTVDADSGRFTTISGTTANFTSYTGLFGGNLQSFDSALDSSFTRQAFKDTVFDAVFDSSLGRKSADDISDGATNKFYTAARFDSDFGTKTTTELSEGNNLYYTKVRVDSDIGLKVDKTFVDALNINAGQVDGVEAASFVRSDQDDTVGANLTFTDGNELRLGTGSDTIIKHTGTATTVNHTGTGKLILQADETDRLSVTDSGVEIDGELYADSIYANGYIVATQDIEAQRDIYVDNWLWVNESANGGVAGHFEGTAAGGLEIHYHSITPDGGLSIYAHDSQSLVGTLQAKFTATEGISFENDVLHLVADPVIGTDVANKRYVDNTAQGLVVKDAARVATTAALAGATYFSTAGPDSGVGAGFDFSPGLDSLDSIPLVAGNRILVKDQALPFQNGIYVYDSSTRITRATDADSHGELGGGVFVFVEEGATQASNGYVTSHSINNHKVGADSVVWTQFSGAGFIEAGDGLVKSGNTIDINLNANSSGLIINTDELLVNAGSGLTITSNTLKVPDDGIKDFHIDFGTGSNQVSTTDVPEGTNEYHTTAKARAAISYDSTGIVEYNQSTGVITSQSIDSIFSQKNQTLDSTSVVIGFDVATGGTLKDNLTRVVMIGADMYDSFDGTGLSDFVGIGNKINYLTRAYSQTGGGDNGYRSVAIGYGAGAIDKDIAIGYDANRWAGKFSAAQAENVAIGHNVSTGKGLDLSVAIGSYAGLTSGYSGNSTYSASQSVIIGNSAGYNRVHSRSVLIGRNAGQGNTMATGSSTALYNTAVGYGTLDDMGATAREITAVGYNAGGAAGTSGGGMNYSTFVGAYAGYSAGNTATISNTTFVGYDAGRDAEDATGTTAIGKSAAKYTQSRYSTYLGFEAGNYRYDSGDYNILLGYEAQTDSLSRSNTLVIGKADVSTGIQRLEIPGMTDPSTGHGVGSLLTLLQDGSGNRYIGFDSAPAVLDSATVEPFARAAISVAGDGVTYNQETGVITVETVTNSFEVTQSAHDLKEGNAVYEDDTQGWIKALATDSGEKLASHIVVKFVDSSTFQIAQNGIFTFETANPGKAQVYTPGEYYYLSSTDSGLAVDAQPGSTSVQPLFYALDSNKVELSVEHAINVFSPDEPINVSRTAGNFTIDGNLLVKGRMNLEGLGVPKVTTLSSGDTYSFDSGNVAKIEFNADASLVFDSPGTTYDGAGFTILAKNTHGSNAYRLTLTTPNGVTLNTVNENKVTVNSGKFAIISGLIYGEKDIILTSTQTDSATTG